MLRTPARGLLSTFPAASVASCCPGWMAVSADPAAAGKRRVHRTARPSDPASFRSRSGQLPLATRHPNRAETSAPLRSSCWDFRRQRARHPQAPTPWHWRRVAGPRPPARVGHDTAFYRAAARLNDAALGLATTALAEFFDEAGQSVLLHRRANSMDSVSVSRARASGAPPGAVASCRVVKIDAVQPIYGPTGAAHVFLPPPRCRCQPPLPTRMRIRGTFAEKRHHPSALCTAVVPAARGRRRVAG
jgi:hypothetical protein